MKIEKWINSIKINDTCSCPYNSDAGIECCHQKRNVGEEEVALCNKNYCPLPDKSELERLEEWINNEDNQFLFCGADNTYATLVEPLLAKIQELKEGK